MSLISSSIIYNVVGSKSWGRDTTTGKVKAMVCLTWGLVGWRHLGSSQLQGQTLQILQNP